MKWIFSPVVFAGLLAVGAIIGSTAQAQDRAAESALEGEFQRGFQLQKQGRTHDAVLAYEAALRRLPQAVNSANSANLLNNLGDLYMIESRFDEAEQSYQACLKLKIQRHGPLARTTLRTMFMLAVLAGQKDDNETALKRYAELLELQVKAFGRDSADVAKKIGRAHV